MAKAKFKLEGYDTFEGGPNAYYPLEGEYDDEVSAQHGARNRLEELEEIQPASSSGGQKGIQDQVFVIRPDGSKYRFTG